MKKHIVGYIFATIISLMVGTSFGFNIGIINFVALDSLPSVLIKIQEDIERDGTITVGSSPALWYIDTTIDKYLWYENSGVINKTFANMFLPGHVNLREEYIKRIIEYRKTVPLPVDIFESIDKETLYNYERTVEERNSFLISKGVPESALTKP